MGKNNDTNRQVPWLAYGQWKIKSAYFQRPTREDYKTSDGVEREVHLKGCREVLIKTVAQAIPTYAISIFKLPKSTCDNINSLLANYWWGQTKEERKIHWINWKKLCTQKKEGGMGFRDLHSFNLAMLSKQAWRLIHDTDSLFYKVYKAQYLPNSSFMVANVGSNPSFVWRSLSAARDRIFRGSK